MFRNAERIGLVLLVFAGLAAADARACRIIHPIPRPIIIPPRPVRPKPILTRYHSADVKIRDQVAEVTVHATFYNPNNFRIEGTYWFPLPAEAAVKDWQMIINGKVVRGELLDAKRARKIYEDIVRKQKDPALLEWVGSQMLKCRIFPMEAHKETKVTLRYTQLLREDAGLVRFDYPLRSARPNAGTIDRLVVHVTIESRTPLKMVYSPNEGFDVRRKSEKTAVVSFEGRNIDPRRDVSVVFSRDAGDVGLSVITYQRGNDDGYFLLAVTPKVKIDPGKVSKKDIVFVCDTSGSMAEDGKIEQAKKALRFCIRSLNPGDRFNIIAFSSGVRRFKPGLVERTDQALKEAQAYIDGLRAMGGTALNDALLAALEDAKNAQNVPMILFLTDGNPTVGEQNVKTILQNIRNANKARCRLFVFGVGYDVNTRLLDLLAEQNRGAREYVKPKENLEVKVSSFYTKVAYPVLSDVTLDFGGARIDDTYPSKLPDLFHGGQLTMLGRFKQPGRFTITLSGKVGDEARTFTYDVEFKADKSNDYLPRLWALRKVAFLLDEIRLHGEKKELVDEITRLGKLHGIITPYTSFLVVEEGTSVDTATRRELRRAGEQARAFFGRQAGGRGAVHNSAHLADAKKLAAPAPKGAAPGFILGMSSGAGGYRPGRTEADDEYKEALEKAVRRVIRQVAGKTFYVKADGTWVDAACDKDGAKAVRVKLWSDAFFALVRQYPELAKVLAETRKVVIVLGGTAYRIDE